MCAHWPTLVSRIVTTKCRAEEVATVIVAGASVAASVTFVPDARGIAGSGLALLMIAIATADARRFVIPDELTAAALGLGFLSAAIQTTDAVAQALALTALRGGALALAFLSLRAFYWRIRGRVGIGLGDVKLAGVAGAWLDWLTIPVAIEIATLGALMAFIVRRFYFGQPIRSTTRLPFGLFFAPAIWVGWMIETTALPLPFMPSF
jgi:leader peptidase (prepilin peptidase)/N-methyltransferase